GPAPAHADGTLRRRRVILADVQPQRRQHRRVDIGESVGVNAALGIVLEFAAIGIGGADDAAAVDAAAGQRQAESLRPMVAPRPPANACSTTSRSLTRWLSRLGSTRAATSGHLCAGS